MSSLSAVQVRELVASGDRLAAAEALRAPVAALAGQEVTALRITSDEYSLNSVAGTADLADGTPVFFKFHAEDGEAEHVGEYYRARVLAEAGLPIDIPLASSTAAGEQLVLYRRRDDQRMVDACLALERSEGPAAVLPAGLAAARRALDAATGQVAAATARPGRGGPPAALHQLFTHRMHDADGTYPGGRLARWYTGRAEWPRLSSLHWEVDGVRYAATLAEVIETARRDCDPATVGAGPEVTAHGDDHHGNVWVEQGPTGPRLVLFDPAFAGDDLPALMALAKPTFHNVFAHPHWLYHPGEVDAGALEVSEADGTVTVRWQPLSPLRQEVLDSIVQQAWIPLLRTLAGSGMLPAGWRRTVRGALALCPLLVTDLLSADRSPDVRMLGLAHVAMMGSEPVRGTDALTAALDAMEEAVGGR